MITRLFNILPFFTAVKMMFHLEICKKILIFAPNIDFGYTLEPTHLGSYNEYP